MSNKDPFALLREARNTLAMWADVAPAVSLIADIDAALAAQPVAQAPEGWNVWFMFDNHLFRKIDMADRNTAKKQLRELFDEDRSGAVFVREQPGEKIIRDMDFSADWRKHGKYVVLDEEIDRWLDTFYERAPSPEARQHHEQQPDGTVTAVDPAEASKPEPRAGKFHSCELPGCIVCQNPVELLTEEEHCALQYCEHILYEIEVGRVLRSDESHVKDYRAATITDAKRLATAARKRINPVFARLMRATQPQPEQVAQDREHAENYRLIRRGQHWSVVDGIGNTLRGDDLDAAVDAIRAARASGQEGEKQ
jgi:hypothetical protein